MKVSSFGSIALLLGLLSCGGGSDNSILASQPEILSVDNKKLEIALSVTKQSEVTVRATDTSFESGDEVGTW